MTPDNRDYRLIQAYELIDAGKVEILSLDIFDTLLWRQTPTPEDVFLLLGRRLKEEGWLIPAITIEGFSELRIKAEKLARQEKEFLQNTSEVTLPEIYWNLLGIFVKITTQQMLAGNVKGVYESDVAELVNIEVSLEKKLIQFDPNILHLLFYAKNKKIPVVLVSDTYFEEPHIFTLLDKSLPIDHMYLSCEWGCDKRHGLFVKMLDELKRGPEKILHVGDNYKSDILAASKEGISTLYYQKYDKNLEDILEREWTTDLGRRNSFLDHKQGDFGISTLRAKISNHVALAQIKKADQFFWKYGASILGPILFGFIHWIYDRCYEMGQSQVFCLMREGKLYANLIKHFAPYYPKHVLEAKQLWVSRDFMAHASIATASYKELTRAMNVLLEHFSVDNFCAYLGLDMRKMSKWSKYQHVLLEDRNLREAFINYLLLNESFRDQIVKNASSKRQRFLNYLSGLIDPTANTQMTLVDVGWSGSTQGSLQEILQLAHSPLQLHGLYLGTTQACHLSLLRGHVREGFLIKGGYPWENVHLKGCFVLEQTATAETGVGSLLDIDDKGDIITNPLLIPSKQKNQARLIQQGIFAFFDMMGPYIKSGAISWDLNSESLQNQLRSLFLRSMVNITQMEAFKFGSWLHDFGPTNKLTKVMGKHHYYDRFIKDMLPIAAFKESGLTWPSAYTAKKSKYLTLASQAVWLKTLPPQCFLSEDTFSLRVFLDKGNGFTKKPIKHVDLRSNPNRNFFTLLKVFSSKKPIERIQLSLSFPSSLVRISSLRIESHDKKNPNSQQIIFFETNSPSKNLECLAEKQIDFNTFYCDEGMKLIHSFETSDVYQITIKLCCEMFKSPIYKFKPK